ncbi:MAG: mechanosensitive ion channel family protein [Saprospiraceae bacterium]|nr:mechanosensitive ion channel family protein [Saprospiraceae bacterium]
MEKELFKGIDLQNLVVFLTIVAGTFIVTFLFNRVFSSFIRRSSLIMRNDPTNYQFLRHFITAVLYIVGFSMAVFMMPPLRTVATSMLAGAGILAVAIGFASQNALSNLISGVFIIMFKPFRVNDRLRVRDNLSGVVEDITLRHTVIRDFENRRIIIPNSVMNQEVIVNSDFSDDNICKWVEISIGYGADIDKAKAILREEAERHPLHVDMRKPEDIKKGADDVVVRVIALGEYAVTLRAWVWANNQAEAFVIGCDLLESVKKRYDAEGIEIPFPYRNVIHRNLPSSDNLQKPE